MHRVRDGLLVAGLLVVAGLAGPGCSKAEDPAPADPLAVPEACQNIAVDPFKELIVVDDAVVNDARASNATGGPWSFRHVVEQLAPPGKTPDTFLREWFATFVARSSVNNFAVPARNPELVSKILTCSWLKRRPANQCDERCGTCAEQVFDLEQSPFRLLAISNRVDLRETSADLGGTGEGRLVFGLFDRAADDPAAVPLRMTVIFEYHQPDSTANAKQWAQWWHDLGKHQAFDEAYRAELATLTERFVARGAAPERPFGTALNQVRTNERELDWIWDLREFHLNPSTARLETGSVFNTPDRSLNGSAQLSDWARKNREAILANQHVVPQAFGGGFAQPLSAWLVPGIDEPLRKALATQTCDGCHQTEQPFVDINFHVSPFRSGIEKLSRHIYAPDAPSDEVRLRTNSMRRALCAD